MTHNSPTARENDYRNWHICWSSTYYSVSRNGWSTEVYTAFTIILLWTLHTSSI